MNKKLRTIDEVCGNPPGTFLNNLNKISSAPEPPKRGIMTTNQWMAEITNWEKTNNIKFEDYLQKFR